jgi:D-3-phosphoglycerate dehydrogenase
MMFAAARQIPSANASTHAGKWEKNKFMGVELAFKTLGLIGCGNIGSIVADRALGLKMKVVVSDPFLSEERARDIGVEKVSLEDLLKRADFISLHTPLTENTKNILNKDSLSKTKKGVIIVNCARGGLVDEKALRELLDNGHVAAAAFDVFESEPATNNILFGHENFVCTPHLGASTNEAQENVALQVAEQISEYLTKGSITNAINIASVSAEDAKKLNPYIKLGESLGKLAGQIVEGGISKVEIEYEGHATELNTKLVTNIILRGLLENAVENVNMINAPVVAAERNIKVSEVKHERESDYTTLVTVTVNVSGQVHRFKGTLFNNEPRIVKIEDVNLEANLHGNMLYVENADKPGFIGALGKVLGDENVNIANFNLGRVDISQGKALALVEVDNEISQALVDKIAKLPNVLKAKSMKF